MIAARHGSGAMGSRGAAMLGGVKREGATAKANQAARFASTFAKQTKQRTVQDADADITLFDEEDGDFLKKEREAEIALKRDLERKKRAATKRNSLCKRKQAPSRRVAAGRLFACALAMTG